MKSFIKQKCLLKNKGFEKGAVTESGAVAVKTGVLLEDLPKTDI